MKPALQHGILMMLWLITSLAAAPGGYLRVVASLVCVGHAALAVFYTWREIRDSV